MKNQDFVIEKLFEIISNVDIYFRILKVKYYQVSFIQDISNQPLVLHLGFFQKVNDVTIFFPLENKFLSNTSNWKPKNILLEFKPQNSKLSLIATLEMCLINNVFCIFISAALRFLRRVISLKDEFYYRFIKVEKLLKPVVDAFKTNGSRYNLLNSAIIDLFEFIKTVCGVVIFAYFQNCQDSTTCRWY